jgi:hypothetical protein
MYSLLYAHRGYSMNNTTKQKTVNGEPYDYCDDFTVLTPAGKREVLKIVKDFLILLKRKRGLDRFLCTLYYMHIGGIR